MERPRNLRGTRGFHLSEDEGESKSSSKSHVTPPLSSTQPPTRAKLEIHVRASGRADSDPKFKAATPNGGTSIGQLISQKGSDVGPDPRNDQGAA